jgi:hypothetical protein
VQLVPLIARISRHDGMRRLVAGRIGGWVSWGIDSDFSSVIPRGRTMFTKSQKLERAPWAAFWFCNFLSLITVVSQIALMAITRSTAWDSLPIVFLCFSPMCFYFVGSIIDRQQGEIRELHSQLAELQKKAIP